MDYLEDRRSVMFSIIESFKNKKNIESLSALALISYMLSSMILSPNKNLYECRKYVEKHSCQINSLCFVPGKFSVKNGTVKFVGRFNKTFLEKLFPLVGSVFFNMDSRTSIKPIKNLKLKELVANFARPLGPVSNLGVPYLGENFYSGDNSATIAYANEATAIFNRYGLGVEAAGRFFELFWKEYFSLVKTNAFLEKFQQGKVSFDCLGYGSSINQFKQVKKTKYSYSHSLESRFKYLLPEIVSSDYGNSQVIKSTCQEPGVTIL